MTRAEDAALDDFLDKQLAKGYKCPSISPYTLSFFFIKKKDDKLQPVQDYWKINQWMVRNQYPLPLITALIQDLGGALIYSMSKDATNVSAIIRISILECRSFCTKYLMDLGNL